MEEAAQAGAALSVNRADESAPDNGHKPVSVPF